MSDAGDYVENQVADYIGANGAPATISGVWLKLHTGAPGETGAANAAGETTRQSAAFAAAAGGQISLSATVTWTNVSTMETYTHVSAWDAATAGNHLWNATMAAGVAVNVGENFDLTSCDVTVD